MESLYKLKSMDEKFRRVIVTHDLTKKVRKECKQLVGEAKAKTSADASGERTYQVRGPPGKMENEKLLFNNMLNVHETMDIQNIKWHLTFLHLCYWLFL